MDLKIEAKDLHNIKFRADGTPFWDSVVERVNEVIAKKLEGAQAVFIVPRGAPLGSTSNPLAQWRCAQCGTEADRVLVVPKGNDVIVPEAKQTEGSEE